MNPPPSPFTIARYLDALDLLVTRARKLYVLWHLHVLEQAHNLDGYPTGASDSTGRRGTSELTTVERHTDMRMQLESDSVYVPETIKAAQQNLADAINTMTRDLGLRATPNLDDYCRAGKDREGAELPYTPYSRHPNNGWADPTCTNLAATGRAGLCEACSSREDAWRRRNGKPPRTHVNPAA